MHILFQHEETDVVLLVDAHASNAFNSQQSCRCSRVLCPTLPTFSINTYRAPTRLFVRGGGGGKQLFSAEGTTQGDPLEMCMYALSKQPLISGLQAVSQAKQGRFADHAPGCEALQDMRAWWDEFFFFFFILFFFYLQHKHYLQNVT